MKGRESGMPDEICWASFFDPDGVLDRLGAAQNATSDQVEFGCGYGTFSLPAARRTSGRLTALDIEPELIAALRQRALEHGQDNLYVEQRDFVEHGTGLPDNSQEHAMLFNLLHIENPIALLQEASRILKPGALLSVIHWRCDIETPRGPPLAIRPTPNQCTAWLHDAGFLQIQAIDLGAAAPFHFGLCARKPQPPAPCA